MNSFKLAIIFSVFCIIGASCNISKPQYYAYSTDIFDIDTSKHLLSRSFVISYKEFLFEFITRVEQKTDVYMISREQHIETVFKKRGDLYIWNKGRYCQFSSFSDTAKLVKYGDLIDKEYGNKYQPITFSQQNSNDSFLMEKPKKTKVNYVDCYVKNLKSSETDSLDYRLYLIKDKNFTSSFKLNKYEYPDKEYCIIGMYYYNKNNKQGMSIEPSELKQLNRDEINTCESLIRKSKF